MEKISIIGIGDDGPDGLPAASRELISQADLLVGDERTLSLVPEGATKPNAERLVAAANLDSVVQHIESAASTRIVVLAPGDPLFYGLARYLCDRLGKERFRVTPHVSSMQLAFARVMESWEDAFLTDLANRSFDNVLEQVRTATKVGLFTSDEWPPARVAQTLLDAGIDYFSAYVCENLGSPDERVTQGTLSEMAKHRFSPLNVMILTRDAAAPDRARETAERRLFGNPEEAFLQSKPKHGLLTPAEVRAMALAQMNIRPASVVWDVGAGSGSVSVEAAQIATGGTVYAIEMDGEDHQLIGENCQRFGVLNVVPVLGKAPEAWTDLPKPDCVFVEGSGREISRIVEAAFGRMRSGGRLVANVGSIENLSEVHQTLTRLTSDVHVWMVNLARGTYQLERIRFDALNPTFLIAAGKQ